MKILGRGIVGQANSGFGKQCDGGTSGTPTGNVTYRPAGLGGIQPTVYGSINSSVLRQIRTLSLPVYKPLDAIIVLTIANYSFHSVRRPVLKTRRTG